MEKQMTRLKMASPCENCCGIFGSPETKNLCSMCFTDNHLIKEKTTIPRIRVKTSSNNLNRSCVSDHLVVLASESYDDHANKRCQYFCDKKAGLFGFRCRCGGRFCQTHRFPEEHECRYNYMGAGREDFLKENPICKPDKLKARV